MAIPHELSLFNSNTVSVHRDNPLYDQLSRSWMREYQNVA